jgi:cobalt-zinc-cadmium efflux system outer membrane protein
VPLPLWNREQGTTAELLARASGAADEVARLTAQVTREVQLALRHRAAAEETWRRYEREALPAAAAARDLLDRGYDAGYLSLPDVLVQQDRLLQVRRDAIDAWLDLHDADAELIEAAATESR